KPGRCGRLSAGPAHKEGSRQDGRRQNPLAHGTAVGAEVHRGKNGIDIRSEADWLTWIRGRLKRLAHFGRVFYFGDFDERSIVTGTRVDERAHRSPMPVLAFELGRYRVFIGSEMFSKQPRENRTDPASHLGVLIGRSTDRDITLGIHAHRTVRQIGGPNPQ